MDQSNSNFKQVALLLFFSISISCFFQNCYTYKWADEGGEKNMVAPPESISKIFAAGHNGELWQDMVASSKAYDYDIGEKDKSYSHDKGELLFKKVKMTLRDKMPPGKVLVNIEVIDSFGMTVRVEKVDLLRLVPRIDLAGEMQYPELLIEEYSRFGTVFRREHGEFKIDIPENTSSLTKDAADRIYRFRIDNNCLNPTKWELNMVAEDYSDFEERLEGALYINQNRLVAHSWFYMHDDLYRALMFEKNPGLEIDPGLALDYYKLSEKASEIKMDYDQLRKPGSQLKVELLELGHQNKRELKALVADQHYKWEFGLFENIDSFQTYSDLLEHPIRVLSFLDRGYYSPGDVRSFDLGFLKNIEDVQLWEIEQENSNCFVEFRLRGKNLSTDITFGNIDLSLLNEQKLYVIPFGANPYPRVRRHYPPQNTLRYDSDIMPTEIKSYSFFTDAKTGNWVNPYELGVDRIYIGWESQDKDILEIYLISYERITPVWMAKVKLSDDMVDRIRVRRKFYSY